MSDSDTTHCEDVESDAAGQQELRAKVDALEEDIERIKGYILAREVEKDVEDRFQ